MAPSRQRARLAAERPLEVLIDSTILTLGHLNPVKACGRFALAYRHGRSFAGVPEGELHGPPISAVLDRECSALVDPPFQDMVRSPAVSHADAVAVAPGGDPGRGRFVYSVPYVAVRSRGDANGITYVQNAGAACAVVRVEYTEVGAEHASVGCHILYISPGDSYPLDASLCILREFEGRLMLRSSQPLAIGGDRLRADGTIYHQPAVAGDRPFDLDGDGDVDLDDVAILSAALGRRVGDDGWDYRLDLVGSGAIDREDLDWLIHHLDDAVPTPTALPDPSATPPPTPTGQVPPGNVIYVPLALRLFPDV